MSWTGRVIDQRDVPMAGMVVSFIDGESSTSTPGYTATTDLDGYFRVGRFTIRRIANHC